MPEDPPIPAGQRPLAEEDWRRLLLLAHTDKSRAFEAYARHYRATSGQVYWSDTHQESLYLDDYHRWLDERLGAAERGSEMITEIYVPRPALAAFLAGAAEACRRHGVDVILHVTHTPGGIARAVSGGTTPPSASGATGTASTGPCSPTS